MLDLSHAVIAVCLVCGGYKPNTLYKHPTSLAFLGFDPFNALDYLTLVKTNLHYDLAFQNSDCNLITCSNLWRHIEVRFVNEYFDLVFLLLGFSFANTTICTPRSVFSNASYRVRHHCNVCHFVLFMLVFCKFNFTILLFA